ncbi:hypothetical protein D910_09473, partial [Dendroctonus ponderosae]
MQENAEDPLEDEKEEVKPQLDEDLPPYYPAVQGCRSVEEFQCLNRIEEGTYGVVYRARDKRTNEIVALKRLKMEKEKEGFPITSLREINTLLKGYDGARNCGGQQHGSHFHRDGLRGARSEVADGNDAPQEAEFHARRNQVSAQAAAAGCRPFARQLDPAQ